MVTTATEPTLVQDSPGRPTSALRSLIGAAGQRSASVVPHREASDGDAAAGAARALIHRLNNDLALPMAALELLAAEVELSSRQRAVIQDAL